MDEGHMLFQCVLPAQRMMGQADERKDRHHSSYCSRGVHDSEPRIEIMATRDEGAVQLPCTQAGLKPRRMVNKVRLILPQHNLF